MLTTYRSCKYYCKVDDPNLNQHKLSCLSFIKYFSKFYSTAMNNRTKINVEQKTTATDCKKLMGRQTRMFIASNDRSDRATDQKI